MKITTNNHPRELQCLADLPADARADFDYVSEDDSWNDRFFKYRGAWYDTQEFVRVEKRSAMTNGFCHGVDDNSPLLAWDGIQTETHFSGVLVRFVDDGERVIVGSASA